MKKIILLTAMVLASCSEPKAPEVVAPVEDTTAAVVTESATCAETVAATPTAAPTATK